jgi:hypothetical protein
MGGGDRHPSVEGAMTALLAIAEATVTILAIGVIEAIVVAGLIALYRRLVLR